MKQSQEKNTEIKNEVEQLKKLFLDKIEETEKKLNTELYNKEGERDDLLHEIELSKLNAIEINKNIASNKFVQNATFKYSAIFSFISNSSFMINYHL